MELSPGYEESAELARDFFDIKIEREFEKD
jgi:hypothetical protein